MLLLIISNLLFLPPDIRSVLAWWGRLPSSYNPFAYLYYSLGSWLSDSCRIVDLNPFLFLILLDRDRILEICLNFLIVLFRLDMMCFGRLYCCISQLFLHQFHYFGIFCRSFRLCIFLRLYFCFRSRRDRETPETMLQPSFRYFIMFKNNYITIYHSCFLKLINCFKFNKIFYLINFRHIFILNKFKISTIFYYNFFFRFNSFIIIFFN